MMNRQIRRYCGECRSMVFSFGHRHGFVIEGDRAKPRDPPTGRTKAKIIATRLAATYGKLAEPLPPKKLYDAAGYPLTPRPDPMETPGDHSLKGVIPSGRCPCGCGEPKWKVNATYGKTAKSLPPAESLTGRKPTFRGGAR